MSIVLAAGSVLDADAEAVIGAAAAAGFDGVGLRRSGEHRGDPAALVRAAGRREVAIHDVEVHRIGPDGPDERAALLDDAVLVGATAVLVVSDLVDRDATVTAVGDLVDAARRRGLVVGLEYMAWTDPSTPADARSVAAATGCRLVVDVLHHTRVGAGPRELAAIVAAGHLGWVQLCDAPRGAPDDLVHEARHERLAPGHGSLPLRALLAEVPPDAVISVEVQSDTLAATPVIERARSLLDATRRTLAAG